MEELIETCGEQARQSGWWDDFPGSLEDVQLGKPLTADQHMWISTKLLLVISEAIEAHDEIRNHKGLQETYYSDGGKPEGLPSELADIIVRVCDMAHNLDIPLVDAIEEKLRYNKRRGYKHGGKVS